MLHFQSMDYIILFIAGVFALWEVYALASARGKILLEGKPFGRTVSGGLLFALFALALWMRRDTLGVIWLDAAVVVVALVLYMLLKAGLGEQGIYYIGRFLPYKKLQHYSIDRETEKSFELRFTNGVKEFAIEFPLAQRELVIAHMLKAQVPDLAMLKGKK